MVQFFLKITKVQNYKTNNICILIEIAIMFLHFLQFR